MSIGERITDIRQSRDLSIQELAKLCSMRPEFIMNIEDGSQKAHTFTYRKIADALNVPLEMILQDSYTPSGDEKWQEEIPESYRWLVRLTMGLIISLGTFWLIMAITIAGSSFILLWF